MKYYLSITGTSLLSSFDWLSYNNPKKCKHICISIIIPFSSFYWHSHMLPSGSMGKQFNKFDLYYYQQLVVYENELITSDFLSKYNSANMAPCIKSRIVVAPIHKFIKRVD